MKPENTLSMQSSLLQKSAFGMLKAITAPRSTLSWVVRGHLAKDPVYISQSYWFSGQLPRLQLNKVFPGIEGAEIVLPRAFDRKSAASITASINLEEACNLAAIAKWTKPRTVLEIGTSDGNTALLLASNLDQGGQVVTVDLPPDFDMAKQSSLGFPDGELNLTPRDQLARQYQGHPVSARIRQVYGDSATLDWNSLGGPFDLAFIDGCHTEEYVRSDSENALRQLAPGGIIVWHDYGMITDVSKVVDQFASQTQAMKVYAIEGTRLAVGVDERATRR